MPREILRMMSAAPRLQTAEARGFRPSDSGPARGLRDLFAPLNDLLTCGGDPRLTVDPDRGLNEYGCRPMPSPQIWSFASSTASSISERAYNRAGLAREEMMRSAIAIGLEAAFDARTEEMREELKAHLQLSAADVEVVFSPSGTDSQLHALFLARSLLGPALTTVVVGSDQTGSGTACTARGHHFSSLTACGRPVRKDAPIDGLSGDSVEVPLFGRARDVRARADDDAAVLDAIDAAAANGVSVLLQIMNSSKLGWRSPSEACLDEIANRWPDQVLIVVDACQMRLGRGRMRTYLDRGYMVLITGSKYFGGPAFSGALLVPTALSRSLDRGEGIAPGFLDYASRSDWPKRWAALRSRFESRPNLGQWLRWEAALEEIRTYYRVPDAFRALALRQLQAGIEGLIMLSPSLRLVGPGTKADGIEDEEFAHPTIFPFTLHSLRGPLSTDHCRVVYRALAQDLREVVGGSEADRAIAAQRCLIGQPVRLEMRDAEPTAALRLCVGARLITETWSPDARAAQQNLQRELDRIASVVAKIELLLEHAGGMELVELAYAN
ncbi:hypothetical protein [Bradyrhizobium sp.]|uniref:hypothetical protein n=1 Tax=Bradyrhizobium sp. TaxID=376 RepID=UPI003BAF3589